MLLQKSNLVIDQLNARAASHKDTNSPDPEDPSIKVWNTLPSSDVWCDGTKRSNRVCKFRNLCYNPKHDSWFISKTKRSVIENIQDSSQSHEALLETSSIENHSLFHWDYEEISPFNPRFQNLVVRYETKPHFMFSRLHPKNIMHNIHDDILGMFFLLKKYIGKGHYEYNMPFSLDTHRVLMIDAYGGTETTRPLQYLSYFPLKFKSDLKKDPEIITCFRDAILGTSRTATFYQYGFSSHQSPIPGKDLNGFYVREVAEWFIRRLELKIGFDEELYLASKPKDKSLLFGTALSPLDLKETDLILILTRSKNRLILNQEQLAQHLTQKYKLQTVFVSNENHKFEKQVELLRRARIVIGMHGSILIMSMFCRRGTVLLELYPFGVPPENYTPYKTLAQLPGMDLVYKSWVNRNESASVGHPKHHKLHGGISHLPKEEQQQILNTKTVPPHFCCTSPYWLYRIYQDTWVDISQVEEKIDAGLKESRDEILSRLLDHIPDESLFIRPMPATDIKCLDIDRKEGRREGVIWASWKTPWNQGTIEKWNIYIYNNRKEFATKSNKPAFAIGDFKTNEEVFFQVRPISGTTKGRWSMKMSCVA